MSFAKYIIAHRPAVARGGVLLLSMILLAAPAFAKEQLYSSLIEAANAAMTLLEAEIARDRALTGVVMTRPHLRATRDALAGGMAEKERVAKSLRKFLVPAVEAPLGVIEETMEAEKQVVEDQRASDRAQRVAYYLLKDNIGRKETALHQLKVFLGKP